MRYYFKDASGNACLLDDVLVMMAKHRKRCVTVADRRSLGAHPIGAVGDFVAHCSCPALSAGRPGQANRPVGLPSGRRIDRFQAA